MRNQKDEAANISRALVAEKRVFKRLTHWEQYKRKTE